MESDNQPDQSDNTDNEPLVEMSQIILARVGLTPITRGTTTITADCGCQCHISAEMVTALNDGTIGPHTTNCMQCANITEVDMFITGMQGRNRAVPGQYEALTEAIGTEATNNIFKALSMKTD